jgi:hypothetical protein
MSVEGYDDTVLYGRFLHDQMHGTTVRLSLRDYICFGKHNLDLVVEMYQNAGVKHRNVIFIRDSDFDRFLNKLPEAARLFYTCGYSVENYVCTEEALTRLLVTTFGIDVTEVNVSERVGLHVARIEQLFTWLTPFFGACLAAIRDGRQLDLNKYSIVTQYQRLARGEALGEFVATAEVEGCGLRPDDFTEENGKLGSSYTSQSALWWLRGKYLLQCTAVFLRAEAEELHGMHKQGRIVRFNRKASKEFSVNTTFERLASVARPSGPISEAFQKLLAAA